MPIARFHILEGRYDDTRLGKLSKAVQQGLMSVLGGRLLPDISHPAANSVLAHAIVNDGVVAAAGISPDDLVITFYEVPGENISFGRGLAQRAHISNPEAVA